MICQGNIPNPAVRLPFPKQNHSRRFPCGWRRLSPDTPQRSGVGFETLYDLRHCGQQDFSGLIPKTLKSLGAAESRRIGRYIAASLYDEFPMPEQTKQAELTRLQEEWARR